VAPPKDQFAPNSSAFFLLLKSNQVITSIFEIKSQTLTHNENMPLKHNLPQATSLNIHDLKSRFHAHCILSNARMIANMLKP